MRIKIIFLVVCFSVFFSACMKKSSDTSRVLVAEVMENFLYLDEIQDIIPPNSHSSDSIEMVEEYVRKWASTILMHEKAKQNISDFTEIDRLVEEYRTTLITSLYQQKLIEQRYVDDTNEEELLEYYHIHSKQMLLKEQIIQGILLVVPQGAPDINNVLSWLKKNDVESIEKIEKYSLQNAQSYDYFVDQWIPLYDVLKGTPFKSKDISKRISKEMFFEASEDSTQYYLRIMAHKGAGDITPYDLVRERIVSILATKQKSKIISKIQDRMYKEGIEKGVVKIY